MKGIHGNTKHGRSWHSIYAIWNNMVQRCLNPKHAYYKFYGAKGINVCDSWNPKKTESAFLNFVKDVGERPKNKTLGRYCDLADYSPEGCCWMTKQEQGLAKRNKSALLKWSKLEANR